MSCVKKIYIFLLFYIGKGVIEKVKWLRSENYKMPRTHSLEDTFSRLTITSTLSPMTWTISISF